MFASWLDIWQWALVHCWKPSPGATTWSFTFPSVYTKYLYNCFSHFSNILNLLVAKACLECLTFLSLPGSVGIIDVMVPCLNLPLFCLYSIPPDIQLDSQPQLYPDIIFCLPWQYLLSTSILVRDSAKKHPRETKTHFWVELVLWISWKSKTIMTGWIVGCL